MKIQKGQPLKQGLKPLVCNASLFNSHLFNIAAISGGIVWTALAKANINRLKILLADYCWGIYHGY